MTETTKCGSQFAPLQDRHTLEDGTEIFLPLGSKLLPRLKPTDRLPNNWKKEPIEGTYD